MKKFLNLLVIFGLVIFTVQASAQTTSFSHTTTNPGGAIVNAGTDTMTAALPGYSAATGIQVVVSKISGTVAGISRLYGSIDGLNYVATGDTLTLADQSVNSVIWKKDTPVYVNYRIRTTGSGTMVAATSAKAVQRKP